MEELFIMVSFLKLCFDRQSSRDQILDDFAAELTELFEATGVVVRQLVVIETKQTQQRAIKIADVVNVLDRGMRRYEKRQ
jgi:hypothetical protein